MKLVIKSKSKQLPLDKVKSLLENKIDLSEHRISLELVKPESEFRGLDPSVLVAIVGAVGVGLGALISGLLQLAMQTALKKIVIQSRDGAKLEIPADISEEKIVSLIEKIKKMEADTLDISI